MTFSSFILYDPDTVVKFLTSNMTDSADTILQTQDTIMKNLEYTKIALLVYSVATVNIYICN